MSLRALLKNTFRKKLRVHLLENKYRVTEAFEIGSTKYYMFDNAFEVPTGRQLAALAIYEEMNMRCTRDYLDKHTKAMEKLLSDPKKISIQYIAQLNINLKERLELMPLPDFVYKLASVVFFDDQESPYSYDFDYAATKIEKWKAAGGTLDFFLKTPLKDLIPSLTTHDASSQMYFQVAKQIDAIHHKHLSDILSGKV